MIYEEEVKLDENHFIIKFKNKKEFFLIKLYPLKILKIDESIKKDLIENKLEISNINEENLKLDKIVKGVFYQPLLIMTTKCNLACKYCYADKGTYGYPKKTMNKKTVDSTLDYLKKIVLEDKGSIKDYDSIQIPIVAFGGESLLEKELIYYLINKSKKVFKKLSDDIGIRISPLIIINTNGILINQKLLDSLKKEKEYVEFVVSFDGLYHDENRLKPDGRPSSEETIKGINLLKKENFNFYLTCCLIPNKIKNIKKNIKYIVNLFGKEIEINLSFIRGALIDLKKRVSYPGLLQDSYKKEDIEKFTKEIIDLIEKGYNLFSKKIINKINSGGFPNRCAACIYQFCVVPGGEVYPCHNFIEEKYNLGNINKKGFDIKNTKNIYNKFLNRGVFSLKDCKDCSLKTICSSSFDCPSHSEHDLGNFWEIDKLICKAGKEIQSAILKKFIYSKLNK